MTNLEKWEFLVKVTHARYDIVRGMPQVDIDRQDAIVWADAELRRLREAINHHRCAIWGVNGEVNHDQDVILYAAIAEVSK